MQKFTEYIGHQFGNPHGVVGKVCCIIMNIINSQMYSRLLSVISLSEGDAILDIGYGNGYLLQKLDKKGKRPVLYGIDISEDMFRQAKKRNQRADSEHRLHLSVGDCCNMPYDDASFHAVTSINTVYFWKDTVQGLSEIRRCLKPGCVFYNVVYTKEWLDRLSYTKTGFLKMTPEELTECGKKAGFQEISVRTIAKGRSFVVMYRK